MKIVDIQEYNYDGYVYNFSVEDNHNYLVNNVVVSNCHYCYTSATKNGINFNNIVDKAIEVWGSRQINDRPFQIAIGGAGESTLHPDWIEFVKSVSELGIMPNYTTNGMHLSDSILNATEKYCGGVAVSYHPHIKKIFHKAIEKLSQINTMLNCHLIISDNDSLINVKNIFELYHDKIKYFVLLPYKAVGRGIEVNVESTWHETFKWISNLDADSKNKFALGALWYDFIKDNNYHSELGIDIYEPEMFSGYRIFDDSSYKVLRKSSYDLRIKE